MIDADGSGQQKVDDVTGACCQSIDGSSRIWRRRGDIVIKCPVQCCEIWQVSKADGGAPIDGGKQETDVQFVDETSGGVQYQRDYRCVEGIANRVLTFSEAKGKNSVAGPGLGEVPESRTGAPGHETPVMSHANGSDGHSHHAARTEGGDRCTSKLYGAEG